MRLKVETGSVNYLAHCKGNGGLHKRPETNFHADLLYLFLFLHTFASYYDTFIRIWVIFRPLCPSILAIKGVVALLFYRLV